MYGGLPQGQRACFTPAMANFCPWQGGPVHRPYGFVPNRRQMGPRNRMSNMTRAGNPQQRMGGAGGQRGMQQQPNTHYQQVRMPNNVFYICTYSLYV